MATRRYLLPACLLAVAFSFVVACGDDDERETPDCNTADCFTEADGGAPLDTDGGSN